jgi:hypothetical protein
LVILPATGDNLRLMKFAGQRVIASGKVFQRSGSRALVIEKDRSRARK